jgi:hypothetical protein
MYPLFSVHSSVIIPLISGFKRADNKDMNIAEHDIRLLEHLMTEEAETLEALSGMEEDIRAAVLERNWLNLEARLQNVKNLSEKLSSAEQIRAIVYEKIKASCKAGSSEGFQDILDRIPPERRGNLAALHRRVRFSVEKVKSLTGGLDAYISAAVSTMDKILEEIFPARRNRLYTRTGKSRNAGHPMVISHSF